MNVFWKKNIFWLFLRNHYPQTDVHILSPCINWSWNTCWNNDRNISTLIYTLCYLSHNTVAKFHLDKVYTFLTYKDNAVEPALCMRIQIQVALCWWKNEWHGDYVHLFTRTHKTTCSQQKVMEFSVPWNSTQF